MRLGPAVQWRVFAAELPLAPASPYDAERALNEVIIAAAAALGRLDVAAGRRPDWRGRSAAGPRLQHPATGHGRAGGAPAGPL